MFKHELYPWLVFAAGFIIGTTTTMSVIKDVEYGYYLNSAFEYHQAVQSPEALALAQKNAERKLYEARQRFVNPPKR